VAFDSHLTNGRNHSRTVCGAERALSMTLAFSVCSIVHSFSHGWSSLGDPSAKRFCDQLAAQRGGSGRLRAFIEPDGL